MVCLFYGLYYKWKPNISWAASEKIDLAGSEGWGMQAMLT